MDQVSLPMRIALLVVLAFAGMWFVVLRPKPPVAVTPPPAAPAPKSAPKTGSGITSAPGKAEAAVAKANRATASRQAATSGQAASTPAPSASTSAKPARSVRPAAKTAAKPGAMTDSAAVRRVQADLDAKRTTVLLFWDRRVADDREVRRAVAAVDRRKGKVRVHTQPIARVGEFEEITRGVPVVTSPTVLVIGGDRRARAVEGLTVTRELDELVGKALAGK